MAFIERLPAVKIAVGSVLLKLGDGNWKMGDGVTVPKTARLGEGDEGLILENFICKSSFSDLDFPLFTILPPFFTSRRGEHDNHQSRDAFQESTSPGVRFSLSAEQRILSLHAPSDPTDQWS